MMWPAIFAESAKGKRIGYRRAVETPTLRNFSPAGRVGCTNSGDSKPIALRSGLFTYAPL
jgi:hypothetical protein